MTDVAPLPPLGALRGHAHALRLLRELAASDGPIPPLLLHGPDGVGKRSAALALAAALVCPNAAEGDACGRCSACQRIAGSDAITGLREKSSAQDSPMTYPDAGFISVPGRKTRISVLQARDIALSLSVQPFELSHRIYIVEPAERMTASAANSLLKILEEPPPYGVLMLVTSAPWALPITVRSRLRELRFGRLAEDELLAILAEHGLTGEEAALRARWSGGSAGRALSIDLDAEQQRVETWVRVLEALAAGSRPGPLAVAASEEVAGDAASARGSLDTLLAVLRDVAASEAGAAPLLLEPARAAALAPAAGSLLGAAHRRAALVERLAAELVIFNRNPRLAVEGAVLALGGTLSEASLPHR